MAEVKLDVNEITIGKDETLEVSFGKRGRYTLSFDASDGDTEIILYDNDPDGNGSFFNVINLYTGTFKEFRKALTKASQVSEKEEESGTATAFR